MISSNDEVMYREYLPDPRLQHLIDVFWVSDSVVNSQRTERILPDGCVDIIFTYPFLPRIVGTMTTYLDITYQSGVVQMIGIRFRPIGITAFSRVPVFEFTDKNVEIDLIKTIFDKSFYEQLPEFKTMQERIISIEKYLISRMDDFFIPEQRMVAAVEYVWRNKGLISVRQIADEVCLSERQLERRFKNVVGVSPKMFSRIIKFTHSVKYLSTCPKDSSYLLAIDCGYYDHSHLIKDFKTFGGILPNV